MRISNFNEYLLNLTKENKEVNFFLDEIKKNGELFVLGGVVRDFFYQKNYNQIRDLDLIFSEDIVEIKTLIEKYNYIKNRFGGYKVTIDNLDIDIWSYKDNWATVNQFLDSKEENIFENISKGTFLNIDSLVYSYKSDKINKKFFSKPKEKQTLDFVIKNKRYIESNPNKPLNIFRIIYLMINYNLNLSLDVIKYIQEYKDTHTNYLSIIYMSQLKHYKCEKMTISNLYLEIQKITSNRKLRV